MHFGPEFMAQSYVLRAPRKIAGSLHWENWLVYTKPSPELTFSRWDGSPLGGLAQFFDVPLILVFFTKICHKQTIPGYCPKQANAP